MFLPVSARGLSFNPQAWEGTSHRTEKVALGVGGLVFKSQF